MAPAHLILKLFATVLLGVNLGSPSAFAAVPYSQVTCIVSSLKRVMIPKAQTSVELEMPLNAATLNLLTTTDGTLAPLIRDQPIPDFVVALAKRREVPDPKLIPFDWLSDQQKIDLIEITKGQFENSTDFFRNRRIQGLTTKEKVHVKFSAPTRFLGVDYPAGAHTIDVSGALQPYVEFGNPESLVEPISRIELHLRGSHRASEMVESSWALELGIGAEKKHKHAHITSPIPWKELQEAPVTTAMQLTDFHRRTNTAAEMLGIVEEKLSVSFNRGEGGVTHFGPVTAKDLSRMLVDWRTVIRRKTNEFKTKYKIGYAGARSPGFYDDPDVWGEEVRFLTRRMNSKNARALLDSVQHQMDTQAYLATRDQIKAWQSFTREESAATGTLTDKLRNWAAKKLEREKYPHLNPNDRLQETLTGKWQEDLVYSSHYQKPWGDIYQQLPGRIKDEFTWLIKRPGKDSKDIGAWLQERYRGQEEVKMLFHDWSKDPLFFNRPEKVTTIMNRQVHALRRVTRGEGTLNEIVREFLLSSGLYREYLESVGMHVRFKL